MCVGGESVLSLNYRSLDGAFLAAKIKVTQKICQNLSCNSFSTATGIAEHVVFGVGVTRGSPCLYFEMLWYRFVPRAYRSVAGWLLEVG